MDGCDAFVEIKGELRERLQKIEGPHGIDDQWGCELPKNHAAPHHALGQGATDATSGKEWWIRWTDDSSPE